MISLNLELMNVLVKIHFMLSMISIISLEVFFLFMIVESNNI